MLDMTGDDPLSQRPKVPAALRRRVLVEAGHRCAIPTCRVSPVEIAHIVPWTDIREHEFSNLIALCPTDHTRYDTGQIDRQSMYQYKRNLAELTARYGYFELRVLHYFAANPDKNYFACAGGLSLLLQGLIDDSFLENSTEGNGGTGVSSAGIGISSVDEETGEVSEYEVIPFAEIYILTDRGRSLVTSWAEAGRLEE